MDALKGTEMRTGGNYCKHEKKIPKNTKTKKKTRPFRKTQAIVLLTVVWQV